MVNPPNYDTIEEIKISNRFLLQQVLINGKQRLVFL
jgi:hypothetical protein